MAHHSDAPDSEMQEMLKESRAAWEKKLEADAATGDTAAADAVEALAASGATGRYPEGKISERDAGELAFSVGDADGNVVIYFGERAVTWVGMTPQQAVDLAQHLIMRARAIATGPLPLVVQL